MAESLLLTAKAGTFLLFSFIYAVYSFKAFRGFRFGNYCSHFKIGELSLSWASKAKQVGVLQLNLGERFTPIGNSGLSQCMRLNPMRACNVVQQNRVASMEANK